MDRNMIKKIQDQILVEPKKLDKKQISVFLTEDLLIELDNKIKKLNGYSDRNINRNNLIELAVETLIENVDIAIDEYQKKYKNKKEKFYDTMVCPSDCYGLDTFIGEKKWYYIRMNEERIPNIKYIALYLGSPVSKITHYGKVKRFEPIMYNGNKRYIVYLEDRIIELKNPIPLGNSNPLSTRSPKYTTLEKLKSAKEFSDLNLE